MRNKELLLLFSVIMVTFMFTGCYHQKTRSLVQLPDSIQEALISHRLHTNIDSIEQKKGAAENQWHTSISPVDSLNFRIKHHYSQGYNFVVKADSLHLLVQQPEEAVNQMAIDSFAVRRGKVIVVADVRFFPKDEYDSTWVHIATEDYKFGWIHEKDLLKKVDPNDPISQFISLFSNMHLLVFLIVISLISAGYLIRKMMKQNAKIVHFNDINSVYPTLLAVVVALSATFYASIQLFAPETWREFYFHPSLNPFSQPLLLNIFLILVWAILILAIAAIDDVRRLLPSSEAFLYLCGLAGVCALNYIIFSVLTLYYVGYILLTAYIFYAFYIYLHHNQENYHCGNCGMRLRRKGRCSRCGAMNE